MDNYYDDNVAPLSRLTPFFIDYEGLVTDTVSLKCMTLRQYLAASPITAISACVGREEPQVYFPEGGYIPDFAHPIDERLRLAFVELAQNENVVWSAYNAAYDVRVAVHKQDVPWPKWVWCAMEGAMGAWPELPGGYGLENVTKTLCPKDCQKFPVDLKLLNYYHRKCKLKPVPLKEVSSDFLEVLELVLASGGLKLDGKLTEELLMCALALYNKRDLKGLQYVHYLEIDRVAPREQRTALRTHAQRRFHFEVDPERLDNFVDEMTKNADYAAMQLEEYLSKEDRAEIFNSEGGQGIQSVRYQRLKNVINAKVANEEFTSTSLKKISPVQLARNPGVMNVLTQTTTVGKMISHKRRSACFRGVPIVDMELGYCRAHTGRFSSPSVGKGLNIHNCVTGDSRVLTRRGWSTVVTLRVDDEIWTGSAFSRFATVKTEGQRKVSTVGALWCTPEQPLLVGTGRKELGQLKLQEAVACVVNGFTSLVAGLRATNNNELIYRAGRELRQYIQTTKDEDARLSLAVGELTTALAFGGDAQKLNDLYLKATRYSEAVLQSSGLITSMRKYKAAAKLINHDVYDVIGVEQGGTYLADGIVVFNCPKHMKAIAKPLRQIYRLPKHLCFVRGDLANLEFRVEGVLTKAQNVLKMFDVSVGGNINNDPYCLTWDLMTGVKIDKKDPVRQVAKSAVLGLGFVMQVIGYAQVILKVLADKFSGVTEDTLRQIIITNRWPAAPGDAETRVISKLGCSTIVARASYHIWRVFNATYPEFTAHAKWLVRALGAIATCGEGSVARDDAKRLVDNMYLMQQDAPDRNLIGLEIDSDGIAKRPVVRVRCGPYPRTVCWREPAQRLLDFHGTQQRTQLSILKSTDAPKGFSPQLAIENVTQAAARNGVCDIVELLEQYGFPDAIHIHDEILLIVPREREAVLKARDAMIRAAGPSHPLSFGWALLIKPSEITVTESLWEDEDDIAKPYTNKKGLLVGNDRWGKIERNEPGMFDDLL